MYTKHANNAKNILVFNIIFITFNKESGNPCHFTYPDVGVRRKEVFLASKLLFTKEPPYYPKFSFYTCYSSMLTFIFWIISYLLNYK